MRKSLLHNVSFSLMVLTAAFRQTSSSLPLLPLKYTIRTARPRYWVNLFCIDRMAVRTLFSCSSNSRKDCLLLVALCRTQPSEPQVRLVLMEMVTLLRPFLAKNEKIEKEPLKKTIFLPLNKGGQSQCAL